MLDIFSATIFPLRLYSEASIAEEDADLDLSLKCYRTPVLRLVAFPPGKRGWCSLQFHHSPTFKYGHA